MPIVAPGRSTVRPHKFSGGQHQKIGIGRALDPSPIICGGISVQAQVINLLADLPREFASPNLLVAHDLVVVEHISHAIAVIYPGKIVELADKRALFTRPQHPYTEAVFRPCRSPTPRRRGADHPEGRRAEPDRPTFGLPPPHPLPLCLRPLLRRGAGNAQGPPRPPRRLPPA